MSAFVGLGIMGGAFARNLVAAGWRVVGYDIDAARRRAMARAGIEIAEDAKTLAAEARTIITSLPKPPHSMRRSRTIIDANVDRRGHRRDEHLCDRTTSLRRSGRCARPATCCSTVR
jgi:prephenate dehydrogenase